MDSPRDDSGELGQRTIKITETKGRRDGGESRTLRFRGSAHSEKAWKYVRGYSVLSFKGPSIKGRKGCRRVGKEKIS